jgi:hypothetical protein
MAKKRAKMVHAVRQGTSRPLCHRDQGRVTTDPGRVSCLDCGREAARLLRASAEAARRKQGPLSMGAP